MIKPIPTVYNGITYRSRTEARWAVFFDMERIPFRYESEGYQAGLSWYVPDFELTGADELVVFEVKPFAPTPDEMRKMSALVRACGAHVFVAEGAPSGVCPIWKITSDRMREPWLFVRQAGGRTAYLADQACARALRLFECEGAPDPGSILVKRQLDDAGRYQFPIFDDARAAKESGASDNRDWRSVERERIRRRDEK